MYERNMLRDRTLILRVLDERLRERLTEKMTALEASFQSNHTNSTTDKPSDTVSTSHPESKQQEAHFLDLEGVMCEPAANMNPDSESSSTTPQDWTLWNFICDGATYPARLTNLPCPIEIHKTHDHAIYYKCTDIAQMLIVYEDDATMEEQESIPHYHVDGFPSYFHSGITPPMYRVVERRFKERDHLPLPPSCQEIHQVEMEILDLISKMTSSTTTTSLSEGGSGKTTSSSGTGTISKQKRMVGGSSLPLKAVEEVEDEIVAWEPWMDDYGREPNGIKFEEGDAICNAHPEIWLNSNTSEALSEALSLEEKGKQSTGTTTTKKDTSGPAIIGTVAGTSASTSKKKKKNVNDKSKKSGTHDTINTTTTSSSSSNIKSTTTPVARPESTTAAALQSGNFDDFNFDIDDLDLDEDNIDLDDMDLVLH